MHHTANRFFKIHKNGNNANIVCLIVGFLYNAIKVEQVSICPEGSSPCIVNSNASWVMATRDPLNRITETTENITYVGGR